MPNLLPNRSCRTSPRSSAWTGEPSALSAKVLKELTTITSVTKRAGMFLATFQGNRSPILKTPLPATSAFGSWSINTLNSWWKRLEPKDRPAQKKRTHPATPPGPGPGNPAVNGALPGRGSHRGGCPATGSAGPHRDLQARQRAGGISPASGGRADRSRLSAQTGATTEGTGEHHGQWHFWSLRTEARLLLPRRQKAGTLSGRRRPRTGGAHGQTARWRCQNVHGLPGLRFHPAQTGRRGPPHA